MSDTAQIIDGKAIAKQIRDELAVDVVEFIQNNSVVPCLAAVLVGDDPASEVYVRNKRRACEHVGIDSQLHRLPADTTQDELLDLVAKLNKDNEVHGILVQLPLPAGLDADQILLAVSPAKDVDAFHPTNVGRLVQGKPRFLPCTPHGVMQLLKRTGIDTAGQHAVVVGRSDIVGKPLAQLLSARGADATVTVCHSRTNDLPGITRQADILIAAIGKPEFITGDMIKPGAVVIDVGVNRTDAGLVGDVEFESASKVASHITPVPGGVGPMTIAMLLVNTLRAAQALEQ
ncbi:bifunctional methylenetetrahydrofolate dehydrogenase/methenyltetrahydrofolate cyclohydrolase FolD [Aeoliella sp. ICT_H6.2]|uniref:Bifunctional protein FolD n=1 Tax=Aeoliella straminimaris TaxID=2954799 RepID=A0A9X2F6Y5_9BACT|nr:bifunctional methylenetetrahydrofolate dehydrogenase/methenyltetrahydrofolate cyclohydrolase FolD [Aeoliella straminimaris]MCO6042939.1 bifunctional methylenetetrahydrofolate dehydrogenase/methenyltetrahydrofolate cyclohydrolase FolD [Aeoliella straminimaris]